MSEALAWALERATRSGPPSFPSSAFSASLPRAFFESPRAFYESPRARRNARGYFRLGFDPHRGPRAKKVPAMKKGAFFTEPRGGLEKTGTGTGTGCALRPNARGYFGLGFDPLRGPRAKKGPTAKKGAFFAGPRGGLEKTGKGTGTGHALRPNARG